MRAKKKSTNSLWPWMVVFGAIVFVFSASWAPAQDTSIWSFITIPDLPDGAKLGRLWADRPCNLYLWAGRTTPGTTDTPEAFLYHWDGKSWIRVLHLSAHSPSDVFGTGPADVFASASSFPGNHPRMWHWDGTAWEEQQLPELVSEGIGTLESIRGEEGNVYAKAFWPNAVVIKYDGAEWKVVVELEDFRSIAYISSDEIYSQRCWGHWLWDGYQWVGQAEFDFCDANHIWGMRDANGMLHLYTSGNNNSSNGVRVWRFTENTPGSKTGSWGSKYGTVFSDPSGYGYPGAGSGGGIWGSGPDDVYVIGELYDYQPNSGRLYHFNGTNWARIDTFGEIPPPHGIWGTGPDDVWVSLRDGRLLHYGPLTKTVKVDIRPGSFYNPVLLKSKGVVPVAVLSEPCFDATTVDRSTVVFAGASSLPIGKGSVDLNRDGLPDIVLHFKNQELSLVPSDTEACLTGMTFDGQEFKGCDGVKIAKNWLHYLFLFFNPGNGSGGIRG